MTNKQTKTTAATKKQNKGDTNPFFGMIFHK